MRLLRRPLLCRPLAIALLSALSGPAEAQQTEAPSGPLVVVVSLNGFRADYGKTFHAPVLASMAAHGASAAEGMIPAYPSEAAPNQYTLATGVYPAHHGLVAAHFLDGAGDEYSSDTQSSRDGHWYGGVPLWVLAEQHGLHSACLFWTGCGAAIAGVRASILPETEAATPDAARVEQAIRCLHLPAGQRPRLVFLALGGVEEAARVSGPDSREAGMAVARADALVGHLRAAMSELRLPVDLVVVSDRGFMQRQDPGIDLSRYADFSHARTLGSLIYPKSEQDAQTIYNHLKIADSRFEVYRRKDLPKDLHASSSERLGDPVVIATEAVVLRAQALPQKDEALEAGIDGLDPTRFPAMRGIFYAEGPDVRSGTRLKPFADVHVYPFLAGLLGLAYGAIDGSAGVLSGAQTSR